MSEIYIYKCQKCNKEFEKNQRIEEGGHHTVNSDCGGKVKFLKIKEPDIVKSIKTTLDTATIEDFKEISKTVFDAFIEFQHEKYINGSLLSYSMESKYKYCQWCGTKLHENIEFSFDKTSYWRSNQIDVKAWKTCLKCKEERDRKEAEKQKKLMEDLAKIEKEKEEDAKVGLEKF